MDGLPFFGSGLHRLELLLDLSRGEGSGGLQGFLVLVVGGVDAGHLGCQVLLLLGDPLLQGLEFFAEDGRGGLFDPRADAFSSVLDLLVGRGAFEIRLEVQDFLGERAVLVEPISEGLREDLSIFAVLSILVGLPWFVGLADGLALLFWRHFADKYNLNKREGSNMGAVLRNICGSQRREETREDE